MTKPYNNVDEYILRFPPEIQTVLKKVRSSILSKAKDASESISYAMPAYKSFGKPLVYFAAFKTHLGFYATPNAHDEFKNELLNYKQGKGSVQFPFDCDIPYDLIERMVEFKANENRLKAKN